MTGKEEDGSQELLIADLREEHIDQILSLMIDEAWYYYDHHELDRYLKMNECCHVLLDGDRVIGSIFTTNYGNQAWLGNIVVEEGERGKGHGARMIDSVITELVKRKVDTFRLASVPDAIKFYQRPPHVFRPEYFTSAQQAALPLDMDNEPTDLDSFIRQIEPGDLEAISSLDAGFSRSNRHELIQRLYRDSIKESCLCLDIRGDIKGFLMTRRRKSSKQEGNFKAGPDHVFRIGPSCISPEYGLNGFKALFQKAVHHLNERFENLSGSAKMYIVFPRNLAEEWTYGAGESRKNKDQWEYMAGLGFKEEYYELVMSHTHDEKLLFRKKQPKKRGTCLYFQYDEKSTTAHRARKGSVSMANTEGIFASATPGDKA